MNTNALPPQKNDAGSKPDAQGIIHENMEHDPNEYHIADGGEFLDEGVRMKDQPFKEATRKKANELPQAPATGV